MGYAAKRDRWNGYNPNQYKTEVEESWRTIEDAKEQNKQEIAAEKLKKREIKAIEKQTDEAGEVKISSDDSSSENSDIDNGNTDQFVNRDPKVRIAVKNLRQREDVAKYLRNLDPDSAYYNGKSRTMKDNPNPDLPDNMQTFKGDNWVKFTGDAPKIIQMEAFMIQENQKSG